MAFRKNNPSLCFLKDYWRPCSKHTRSELDVYKKLAQHGVRHVATALGGGDITGQINVTDKFLENNNLVKRLHARIAIGELARPLEEYENSAEMILIVFGALEGAYAAMKLSVLLITILCRSSRCMGGRHSSS